MGLSEIGMYLRNLIEGALLLFVLYVFIKTFIEIEPSFGQYIIPVFLAAAAVLLLYARYGYGR